MNQKKSRGIFSEFARYTSLNVMGMLGLSCYILADTYFVSAGLGTNGLAALNLAIPVYSMIHGCGLMLGIGGGTRYALRRTEMAGDGDRIFTHTILCGGAFSIIFMLIGIFGASGLTALLGADTAVFPMTKIYLQVLLIGAPAFLFNDILIAFVRNDAAPQRSMAAMLCGSFSNILLDYLFIFPLGMGIFGAVLATVMAAVISMLVLSPFFLRGKNHFHLCRCRIRAKLLLSVLSCGLPSLVMEISSGVVMIVWNMILLRLSGNVGVAAYGVIANLSLVVLAVFNGMGQGIQPLVSRCTGTNDHKNRQNVLRYTLAGVLILSAAVYALLALGAEPVAAVFNSEHDPLLQTIAVSGIRLYFTGTAFAGINAVLAAYFAASGEAIPANILTFLRGFILIIPFALLLSALFGVNGLWLAFPTAEALSTATGVILLKKTHRKAKETI